MSPPVTPIANVAAHLTRMAAAQPYRAAIVAPAGLDARGRARTVQLTYAQLDEDSDRIARGLASIDVGRGTRTVLMVRPSLELFSLVFGLFKAGAVPVMVDPGMGRASLRACIDRARPEAFIGIGVAHAARAALGWGRRTVRTSVVVGSRRARLLAPFAHTLDAVRERGARIAGPALADVSPSDLAAILFTSGSTGVPKGAEYRHETFLAQVDAIRAMYGIEPGEVDLPTFPLFALFDPALGMTTIVPDMDPTKPAAVDPVKITSAIDGFGVTNMFGSPALLDTVARWANPRGVTLPSLRRVITAGAPVAPRVFEAFARVAPNARIASPYGATEALPVSSVDARDVLAETRARTEAGEGICVGDPVPGVDVDIVAIDDAPIARWSDARRLPTGEIGEIVVRGAQVTRAYWADDDATARAKISDDEGGAVRHRMGDVGYRDARGRLWFCGRKAHRVELEGGVTLFSTPCEGPFDAHPLVRRSALVGARVRGRVVAALCVEPWTAPSAHDRARLARDLAEIAERAPHTQRIVHFLLHPAFPVDVRHNAKIRREELAPWASAELEKASSPAVLEVVR